MEFRQLRYFARIGRLKSFTQAARELNVAQPALSRQIRLLEEELGVTLLHRNTHRVELSSAGSEFLLMCEHLLQQTEGMRQAMSTASEEPSGTITVGLLPSIANLVAPRIVARIRSELPRVQLKIVEATGAVLKDWLPLGRVDVAVISAGIPIKGAASSAAWEVEFVLIGTKSMLESLDDPISFSDLAKLPLLITSGFRSVLSGFIEASQTTLNFDMELDSISILKSLSASGAGLSILPYPAIEKDFRDGILDIRRIAYPTPTHGLLVSSMEYQFASRARKAVEAMLLDEISRLPTGPTL